MAESDGNMVTTVVNTFVLIFEIILTIAKFWTKVIESIYVAITAEEKSVQGEVVLITGAGHGIGKELAMQYSELGATIVCWDINEQMNLDTVNLIKSKGRKAYGYTVDVTKREKVLESGKKVLSEVGAVTILVNNAGIMPQHELLKHTEEEIRLIFEINVIAHFWLFEAFLPKMIENNKGHIVALSSMAGVVGLMNLVPYCGSKFAVRGIQEALAAELRATSNGESKIKFTTIFPFMVATGLCKQVKIRFESFMGVLEPKYAASAIISAQRKELDECSIPRYLFHLNRVGRILPNKAVYLIKDFMEANVLSDK